jgi:uncharacterized RDD family membrane protein YckC
MSSDLFGAQRPAGSFVDKLTIETPEQTALDFAVAGIGSRSIAVIIDILIQCVAAIVLGFGGGYSALSIQERWSKAGPWAFGVLILLYFLLYFGYFAIFEIVWNGQSPGKRLTKLRVIKDSGRPISPAEAIGRNLMRIVDWMPVFYAVGLVSMAINKQNKRLGDLLVGAIVVRESTLSDLRPVMQSVQDPVFAALPPMGAAALTAEESGLIESYLYRRLDLDPVVRYRMADDILNRIRAKLTLPTDTSISADRLLEALSFERRATGRYV